MGRGGGGGEHHILNIKHRHGSMFNGIIGVI